MAGAFEGALDGGYFPLLANESGGELVQRLGSGMLIPEVIGQRLQCLRESAVGPVRRRS